MNDTPLAALKAQIGHTRRSAWLLIDQEMIDRFADVTGDRQFIHVDPVRAAATPFGGTVAHGFLLLALLPRLYETLDGPEFVSAKMGVNYGSDRLRFITPVRAGSRVRVVTTLLSVEEKRPGQLQQTSEVTMEIEGADKPALAAIWLSQLFV